MSRGFFFGRKWKNMVLAPRKSSIRHWYAMCWYCSSDTGIWAVIIFWHTEALIPALTLGSSFLPRGSLNYSNYLRSFFPYNYTFSYCAYFPGYNKCTQEVKYKREKSQPTNTSSKQENVFPKLTMLTWVSIINISGGSGISQRGALSYYFA